MTSSIPVIRNIPIYGQHPNGCGLASLLMLLDLPQNPKIEKFLRSAWDQLHLVFNSVKYNHTEMEWAIVLQYLLLKAQAYSEDPAKEVLYEFFNDRLEWVFEDQRIMNKFLQEGYRESLLKSKKIDEAYTFLDYLEGNDYVTPYLLMKNLHTMKTDLELKILAELFNYQFKFQESEDNTGAIYFTAKELAKKLKKDTKTKWTLLEKCANDPKYIILYGKYHHWLAVRGIYRTHQIPEPNGEDENQNSDSQLELRESQDDQIWIQSEMIIEVNDPASMKISKIRFPRLRDSDRFYILEKRPINDYPIFDQFLKCIKQDIHEEAQRWVAFLKKKNQTMEVPPEIQTKIKSIESLTLKELSEKDEEFFDLIDTEEEIDDQ